MWCLWTTIPPENGQQDTFGNRRSRYWRIAGCGDGYRSWTDWSTYRRPDRIAHCITKADAKMTQYLVSLKPYLNEPSVTLFLTAAGLLWVWFTAIAKKKDMTIHDLWMFAVLLVTAITGVFIFFGAFPVIQTSPQNGLWGGVTGVCMAIYSWIQFKKEFKRFFSDDAPTAPKSTT